MSNPSRTAAQLRQDFDRSFAEPAHRESESQEDYLAIRLGGDDHALHLSEIAHLLPLKALTRLPGPLPELLGITGFRGAIVPVYDLAALLGYTTREPPLWLVVAAAAPVAFAFDAFEGHLRLALGAVARQAGTEPSRRHVREVLRTPERVRPIVSMASILETIGSLVQQAAV